MDPRLFNEWEYTDRYSIDPIKGNDLLRVISEPGEWRSKKFDYSEVYRTEAFTSYLGKDKNTPTFKARRIGDNPVTKIECYSSPIVSFQGTILIADNDNYQSKLTEFFLKLGLNVLYIIRERHRLFSFTSTRDNVRVIDCHLSEIVYAGEEEKIVDYEFGIEKFEKAHPADVFAVRALLKEYVYFKEKKKVSREIFAEKKFSKLDEKGDEKND